MTKKSSAKGRNMKTPTKGIFIEENLYKFAAILTLAALLTRFLYIDMLPGTTWDEVHFGKFASSYINRTFFHDVHPPAGKMFLSGLAYMTGYKGNFNFSVSNYYDETINIRLIRGQLAILGSLLVPLTYFTVFELTLSVKASVMAATAVLCDTYLHRITTLFLLDSPLLFVICFAVYSSLKFANQREWSFSWWGWLFMTGINLGIVISIKYIGFFTICFVGFHTACQLIAMLACAEKPWWLFIPHTLARVVGLILLPIVIYVLSFVLHFTILTKSSVGEGGWINSRFYSYFEGTEYVNKTFPEYVSYGSEIILQGSAGVTGYLDSWFDLFPSEYTAPCQMVSVMPMKDQAGPIWQIKKVIIDEGRVEDGTHPLHPPYLVRNGDHVMLTHKETTRSLRSHGHKAPFTRRLYQVCGFGDNGSGGGHETWQIIIPGAEDGEALKTIRHDFMLKNYQMNCYLKINYVDLPKDWGSNNAKEVACTRNPQHNNLLWHVHWIESQKPVGKTKATDHTMNIWERICHLHEVMFVLNSMLKDNTEISSNVADTRSQPLLWPIVYNMQLLSAYNTDGVSKDESNIFAVTSFNPVIAYINILCFFSSGLLTVYHFYMVFRGKEEEAWVIDKRKKTLNALMWIFLCWASHYIPFFFMSRTLYTHHYCPAYIYSCMISGILLSHLVDAVTSNKEESEEKNLYLTALILGIMLTSYYVLFSFATYIEGYIFEKVPSMDYFLNALNFGQPWNEVGYKVEGLGKYTIHTELDELTEESYQNPNINVSLFYGTKLNNTMENVTSHVPTAVFRNYTNPLLI